MRIKAVGHNLIVKPFPVEEVSAGGIVLNPSKREQAAQVKGELVSIGPNAWKAFDDGEPWAELGQTVFYAQYGGAVIKDEDGEEYRLLRDEDIAAVCL